LVDEVVRVVKEDRLARESQEIEELSIEEEALEEEAAVGSVVGFVAGSAVGSAAGSAVGSAIGIGYLTRGQLSSKVGEGI
jgi:phage tail tape-measure protein